MFAGCFIISMPFQLKFWYTAHVVQGEALCDVSVVEMTEDFPNCKESKELRYSPELILTGTSAQMKQSKPNEKLGAKECIPADTGLEQDRERQYISTSNTISI